MDNHEILYIIHVPQGMDPTDFYFSATIRFLYVVLSDMF